MIRLASLIFFFGAFGITTVPVAQAQSVSQKYVQEQQAAKKKQADLIKQSTQKKTEAPKR